ncbi:MAG: hypothetical protein M3165_08245 [Actinomycetota bacterium]|nr:hypothetical protein [Actinomycetota bacterium]
MSDSDRPERTEPAAGESESVGAPHRDDRPPRRGSTPVLWVALIVLAALAVGGLLVALGFGLLD